MKDGTRKAAKAKLGDNLLDVVLENNLDIDGFGKFSLLVFALLYYTLMFNSSVLSYSVFVDLNEY